MQKDLFLGIDIGSVTIKTALFDRDKTLLSETYTRIKGDPLKTLRASFGPSRQHFSTVRSLLPASPAAAENKLPVPLGLCHQRDTRPVRLCRPLSS